MRWRAAILAALGVVAIVAGAVGWQRESPRETVTAGSATNGAVVFQTRGCAACHEGPDSTPRLSGRPSLADAPSWADGRRPDTSARAYIAESIREPAALISPALEDSGNPTATMPDLGLSDDEIDDVVAYLLVETTARR